MKIMNQNFNKLMKRKVNKPERKEGVAKIIKNKVEKFTKIANHHKILKNKSIINI